MATISDLEAQLLIGRSRPERQQLGQFFTPETLAAHIVELALQGNPRTLLDPAVGAGRLLQDLPEALGVFGMDVDDLAVGLAKQSLGDKVNLAIADFLDHESWPFEHETFDAIVANPPYVRHHRLTAAQKARRLGLNKSLGIELSGFADYYVYFFCEALRRLNDGGRLVFVTPSLFLDARYGEALKSLLMRDGTIEQVVVFDRNRGVFDEARTAAAITVVRKGTHKAAGQVAFTEAHFNGHVEPGLTKSISVADLDPGTPWSLHLPSRATRTLDRETVAVGEILRLRRGLATGSNGFFCLTDAQRREHGIPDAYLRPVLTSAKHISVGEFSDLDWATRLENGDRVWLLWCRSPVEKIRSKRVREYLASGEASGVHLRTMCKASASRPWYAVENVEVPDYLFTYMSKKPLRFVRNSSGARALTALLCGWLRPGVDAGWAHGVLTSHEASQALTQAAQDLGAGLRKIEPRRLADVALPLPS